MVAPKEPYTGPLVELNRYTRVWRVGTGLPAALAPGAYRITNRRGTPDGDLVVLENDFYLAETDLITAIGLRPGAGTDGTARLVAMLRDVPDAAGKPFDGQKEPRPTDRMSPNS